MRSLRAFLSRLAGLLTRGRRHRDFDAELESHLQLHADDNLRAGMTADEARRQAVLKFGGIEATREAYRDRSSLPLVEQAAQDLRFAIRFLARTPGFTLTAVATLALGVGATLAILAFVDAALVAPLPYRAPDRLVDVTERTGQIPHANLSYPDYQDWKRTATSFSAFAIHDGRRFSLRTPEGGEPVVGARVTADFFRTLGVAPLLGRDFHDGEDAPGVAQTAILSYASWQARFAGRPDIVGQTVVLDGQPCTIVGVLPKTFHFALRGPVEFWTPIHVAGSCDASRGCHSLVGVARLKDGVSVEQARAETTRIAADLERQYPDTNRGQGAVVTPLADAVVGDVRPLLLVLLGGAALLLVIAAVNVVSLLLVRGEGRRREMALRSTLGASSGRLTRQFVTEAGVLAALGTAAGVAAASGGARLLLALVSEDLRARMPYLDAVGINGRLLANAGLLAVLLVVLFSLAPALRVRGGTLRDGLAEGSRGSSGHAWRRLGFKLVVFELATAMVLIVGASLLGRSLYELLGVRLAFEPDGVVAVQAGGRRADTDERKARIGRDVLARSASIPGVAAAGLVELLPVSFNGNTDWIRFVGRPYNGEHNEVNQRAVSAGYFQTIGAHILRGRGFTDRDTAGAPKVVIVNQALVRKYFADGQDPIGARMGGIDLAPDSIKEIVGIVDDIHEGALDAEIWPAVYYPFEQDPSSVFAVVVRTAAGGEATVLRELPRAVREADSDIVTMAPVMMRDRIHESPAAALKRSTAWLVGGFAALALVLGTVGLYGVIAYSVGQRTREIGVRLALGAEPRTVHRQVLAEAGRLIGLGVAVGAAASVGVASLSRALLFGTMPWDPWTLAGSAAILAATAALASYLPARRAASVNPIEALRAE